MRKPLVYLAGPGVFLPNPLEHFAALEAICNEVGLEALIPYHKGITDPLGIYEYNLLLLSRANIVVADVSPFRGVDADSGTAWEMGYAAARDLPIVTYSSCKKSIEAKTLEHFKLHPWLARKRDLSYLMPDGMRAETWGFPLNLMLEKSSLYRAESAREAITHAAGSFHGKA